MRTPVGRTFPARYGPWALVVGGSDGIGAAFAHDLAGRGLHLVLVARRAAALRELARELEARHGVRVRALVRDAAAPGAAQAIMADVADLDLGLLVCNAALGPVGPYLDLTPADIDSMLALNCQLAAQLAHATAGRMRSRHPAGGGIILLSSMAGLTGSAQIAHYAATKAYLLVLAEGLWRELRPSGVDVLACCPGRVTTPTMARTGAQPAPRYAPGLMAPGPVARQALAALGRQPVVIPGRWNQVAASVSRLLPRRHAVALVSAATLAMYPPGRTGSRRSAPPGA